MELYEQVVQGFTKMGKPVSAGEIAKHLDADKKEVDKIFAKLKKEEKIVSPIRCKWELKKSL